MRRSKIYSDLFPDELMLETFGTTMPSQSAMNEYFFNRWMDWNVNEVRITSTTSLSTVKTIVKNKCRGLGLREFWDFQSRGYAVRFKDSEMLAFFKISLGES
jgi:hypothetical protein